MQDKSKQIIKNKVCGIIMPISESDEYSRAHWIQIRELIEEAVKEIEDISFKIRMVSESETISILQKVIIKNIYNDDIIICDVSSKNPNVMFELGMRLAFNKPVIIIKDTETDYSFDTSNIRHIIYPKTLNYFEIKKFKEALKKYIIEGCKEYDRGEFDFLKEFGEFKVEQMKNSSIGMEDLFEYMREMSYKLYSFDKTLKNVVRLEENRKNRNLLLGIEDNEEVLSEDFNRKLRISRPTK